MHAVEVLEAVLSSVAEVPVVVVADSDDRAIALRAIHEGAQDYLIGAATDADALDRAIRYAIERKRTAARLAHQALHDSLTGLPNRVLLRDRLGVAVGRTRRRPNSLALLFLDLDGFKSVNDGYGHDAGDDLLVEVARRLQRALRPGDTVVRYGGDEFVILCEDLHGQREALRVAERARAAIAEPFLVRGHDSGRAGKRRRGSSAAGPDLRPGPGPRSRPRDVPSQAARERRRAVRHRDDRRGDERARDRASAAVRTRARRAAPPLPANPRPRPRPEAGCDRGADPLGAPCTGVAGADRVPAPGRGDRADRADRPVGALRSLSPVGALASGRGSWRRGCGCRSISPLARLARRR